MTPYRLLADALVLAHFLFIVFVVAGVLLVVKRPRAMWLHVPAVIWAAVIEFSGWICPLTPLENKLRVGSDGAGYTGGFIDHYIMPLIYPSGLTREMQFVMGGAVIVINLVGYGILIKRKLNTKLKK